jgi:hypothetical protein
VGKYAIDREADSYHRGHGFNRSQRMPRFEAYWLHVQQPPQTHEDPVLERIALWQVWRSTRGLGMATTGRPWLSTSGFTGKRRGATVPVVTPGRYFAPRPAPRLVAVRSGGRIEPTGRSRRRRRRRAGDRLDRGYPRPRRCFLDYVEWCSSPSTRAWAAPAPAVLAGSAAVVHDPVASRPRVA